MNLRQNIDVWHNGVPYRLVRFLWDEPNSHVWLAQPLFVDAKPCRIRIRDGDDTHEARFHSKAA